MNEGIQIAQRGAIDVPGSGRRGGAALRARSVLSVAPARPTTTACASWGSRDQDPDTGAVVGQFPHVFPASIAIGYGLDGLTGARRAVGVWAILGVLAVYFRGPRACSARRRPRTAAALLTLNVAQVWFARYPNAEMVMQALLFAALLASARAHVDGDGFFAPVAGTLLGLLLFLRFDAVLGIAAVLAALALGVCRRTARGARLVLRGVRRHGGAAPARISSGRCGDYADLPIVFLSHLPSWQYAAAGGSEPLLESVRSRSARACQHSAIGCGRLPPRCWHSPSSAPRSTRFSSASPCTDCSRRRDAYSLRTFTSFYLTVPGLLAALLGFALVARACLLAGARALHHCGALRVLLLLQDPHRRRSLLDGAAVSSGHPARRAAVCCRRCLSGTRGGWAPTRVLRTTIGWRSSCCSRRSSRARPSRSCRTWSTPASFRSSRPCRTRSGDRDLLVVESRNASDTHVLALPLAYIYARNVLVLNSPKPDKTAFAGFLDWARNTLRPGALHGRRRHGPPGASVGRPRHRERAVPDSRVRRARRRLPAIRAPQGVRLQPVRAHAAGRRQRAPAASISTSASTTTCTSSDFTPRS